MRPRPSFIIALVAYMCIFLGGGPFTSAVLAKITMKSTDEQVKIVTIKKGDTLWDLAVEYVDDGVKWPWFKKYNDYNNPDLIFPGEEMQVPLQWITGVVDTEKTRLREELDALRAQYEECQAKLAAAQAEIADLKTQIAAIRAENDALRAALQSKDDEIAELHRQLDARPAADLSGEIQELRALLEDTAMKAEVRKQIRTAQNRLSKRIDELEKNLKVSLEAMSSTQSRGAQIDVGMASITDQLTQLQEGLAQLQSRPTEEPPAKGNKKLAFLAAIAGGIAWIAVNALSNSN